jgi:RNA polymerase sigma-70 factor (ECF subfamily)
VVLCDVQGLSYDEAARAMGVELGTVKSRLSRARSQLRDRLAALGELPAAARRLEE